MGGFPLADHEKSFRVLSFSQPDSEFTARCGTFGFEPVSNVDGGTMWPTAYTLLELTTENRSFLAERIRLAVS